MKKFVILLCCFITSIAHAAIKGEGIRLDANDKFLSAFENCTPYTPMVRSREEITPKELGPDYEYIEIIGKHGDKCIFNMIMQFSTPRLYSKVVKHCTIKMGEQMPILEAIRHIPEDKGSLYLKASSEIMDRCEMLEDINIPNSNSDIEEGYITIPEKDGKLQLPESCK